MGVLGMDWSASELLGLVLAVVRVVGGLSSGSQTCLIGSKGSEPPSNGIPLVNSYPVLYATQGEGDFDFSLSWSRQD
jgi:hypothetical protein